MEIETFRGNVFLILMIILVKVSLEIVRMKKMMKYVIKWSYQMIKDVFGMEILVLNFIKTAKIIKAIIEKHVKKYSLLNQCTK